MCNTPQPSSPERPASPSSWVCWHGDHHVPTHHVRRAPPPPSPPAPTKASVSAADARTVGALSRNLCQRTRAGQQSMDDTIDSCVADVHTLICRPLKRDSFSSRAFSTISFSTNSIYANLQRETHTHTHHTRLERARVQGARRLGIPFGVPRKLVTDDGDTVDGTAGLEVLAQLLSCGLVVHLQWRGEQTWSTTHTQAGQKHLHSQHTLI